ncbi:MAG: hypothetical protein P1V35_11745, partial [Planctomycetota bacterium]|nr:hypothetical protein [Planctomycetota bacterium]
MSFKKTLLLLSLFLFAAAQPADARIQDNDGTPVRAYFLTFKDAKDQKSLQKKAVLWKSGEEFLVVGEVVSDEKLKLGAPAKLYQVILPRKAKISKTLAVAPYEFDKDGKRKPISKHKKAVISVPAKNLVVVDTNGGQGFKTSTLSDFGLYSLCSDLERRRVEVEDLRSTLKGLKKKDNPDEWKTTRDLLLLRWEGLVAYVENFPLFEPMGGNLRAE